MYTFFEQFDIIYINSFLESLHRACNCQYCLFIIITLGWKY
jgi:hypothetical protein